MPKVTVYIRNEDYELWKSIKKKTTFIHKALRPSISETSAEELAEPLAEGPAEAIASSEALEVFEVLAPPAIKKALFKSYQAEDMCEHGAGRGFCKIKKCPNWQFRYN